MSTIASMPFNCVACGQQYRWKPEIAGKKSKCIKCGQRLVIPLQPPPLSNVAGTGPPPPAPPKPLPPVVKAAPPIPPPKPAPVVTAKPAADDQSPGQRFALQAGIDLNDEMRAEVPDKQSGEVLINSLKQEMPETPSAYRPSGKTSSLAVLCLLSGAVGGAPLGALVGAVAAAVGGLILAVLWAGAASVLKDMPDIVRWIAIMVGGSAMLAVSLWCLVGPWALMGFTAAFCTFRLGRRANNRSVLLAALFATGSSLAATYLLTLAALWANSQMPPGLVWFLAIVTGAISVGTAIYSAANDVREARFCEKCQCYMPQAMSKSLGFGCLKAVRKALQSNLLTEAADLMSLPQEKQTGSLTLFKCPCCADAYVDVSIAVALAYQGSSQSATWRVTSLALTAVQAALLERGPLPSAAARGDQRVSHCH